MGGRRVDGARVGGRRVGGDRVGGRRVGGARVGGRMVRVDGRRGVGKDSGKGDVVGEAGHSGPGGGSSTGLQQESLLQHSSRT